MKGKRYTTEDKIRILREPLETLEKMMRLCEV